MSDAKTLYEVTSTTAKIYNFPRTNSTVLNKLAKGAQLLGTEVTTASKVTFVIVSSIVNTTGYSNTYVLKSDLGKVQFIVNSDSPLYTNGIFGVNNTGTKVRKGTSLYGSIHTINGTEYLQITGSSSYNNKLIKKNNITQKSPNSTAPTTTQSTAVNLNTGTLLGNTYAGNNITTQAQLDAQTKSKNITEKANSKSNTTISSNSSSITAKANDEYYYINGNNVTVYKNTALTVIKTTIPNNFLVSGSYVSGRPDVFKITSPTKYEGYALSKYIAIKKYQDNIPGTSQPKSTATSTKEETSSNSSTINTTTTADNAASSESVDTTNNAISELYSQMIQELLNSSDDFTIVYGDNNLTDSQYRNNIDGLQVKDIRGILGCPHQFLPIADARIDNTNTAGSEPSIGRVYADKILKQMPLLLITPGVPELLTSFSKDQKASILKRLFGDNNRSDIENLFSKCSGKYYSLKYAYTEYFYYVNAMLRAAAYFLQIENTVIDGRKLSNYNWLYYTTNSNNTDGDIFGHEGLRKFLGPYAGCIAMYADCGNNVDDTFSNNTSQSSLSSMIDGASDKAREINFLIGNIGGLVGIQTNRLTSMENLDTNISEFTSLVDRIVGHKNGFISRVAGQVQTILAGGRMIFPEIWSDSSFSRSYNCKMKLVSPSGDKLSIYLNILVPIYHLLGLVLPRQGSGQTYYSPFLVRGYCKGLFNVDLGILGDLNVTKGEEGEWTKDGLPTVAEVSFTIKDLYDGMFMSKYENPLSPTGIMSNITELDYIANSCGINVNDQEIIRTIKMYVGLGFGDVRDRIDIGIFGNIAQYFNQKLNNIFGVFK